MRNLVAIDSGPLAALFIPDDRHHARAVAFASELKRPPLTTMPVITEVMYLLDFSTRNQQRFLEFIARDAVEVVHPEAADWERYLYLTEKYADLPADFADISLVAACERRMTRRIASIDSDFTIYRYNDRQTFENVF